MDMAMLVFVFTLKEWQLTDAETRRLAGDVGDVWTEEQIQKAALVKDIYLNLQSMPPKQARTWPRKPNGNPRFGGRPPLDLMLAGVEGLERVLKFLMAQNGGPL